MRKLFLNSSTAEFFDWVEHLTRHMDGLTQSIVSGHRQQLEALAREHENAADTVQTKCPNCEAPVTVKVAKDG